MWDSWELRPAETRQALWSRQMIMMMMMMIIIIMITIYHKRSRKTTHAR